MSNIRQNILFGQPFDHKRYEEVVEVCALKRDFALFPFGDETLVGDRGVTLSGGQKARINLARAVYRQADIYLLDDPLSAVDTHVGKHIFEKCIQRYLSDKCVILVTHQLQYLRYARKIYLLDNGTVKFSGTFEEIHDSGHEYAKLLVELNEKLEEESSEEETVAMEINSSKTGIDKKEQKNPKAPTVNKESKAVGNVAFGVYGIYFQNGGHWCKALWILLMFIAAQSIAGLSDYFVSWW